MEGQFSNGMLVPLLGIFIPHGTIFPFRRETGDLASLESIIGTAFDLPTALCRVDQIRSADPQP